MAQTISRERTVTLPEYCGSTPGLQWPVIWPPKDPFDAGMDFSLDVSGWLTDIQDTVGSVLVGSAPNDNADDLVITSAFSHNGVLTVLVDGGRPFVNYTVTFSVTSAVQGQVLTRSVLLPVQARYSNSVAQVSISGVVQ